MRQRRCPTFWLIRSSFKGLPERSQKLTCRLAREHHPDCTDFASRAGCCWVLVEAPYWTYFQSSEPGGPPVGITGHLNCSKRRSHERRGSSSPLPSVAAVGRWSR